MTFSCNHTFPKSGTVYINEEDVQGYYLEGYYCSDCAEAIKAEVFQVEDEDVYDIEDE